MKNETMDIHLTLSKKKRCLIKLDGKFNIESVPMFEEKMEETFENEISAIIFDFKELKLIDSSGIGSLIKALNTAKNRDILFYMFNVSDEINNIFIVSYLDKFFKIKTQAELKQLYPELVL